MTQEVKPSVKQEDAIQKQAKSVSDKKTANKSEVFYSSVAYLQMEDDTKALSNLHQKGHVNKLLKEAASYDQGDAIGLRPNFQVASAEQRRRPREGGQELCGGL
jgi:hypothetical protein